MDLRIYCLFRDELYEVEDLKAILAPDPGNDQRPDVWLEVFMDDSFGPKPIQNYQLGWKIKSHWNVTNGGATLRESRKDGAEIPINIRTQEDISELLAFVTLYRSIEEAARCITADYGIPALQKHSNGGKCRELQILRILLERGPAMFANGLNQFTDILRHPPTK